MTQKTHKCEFCCYCSKRRFDLKRHHNDKHHDKLFANIDLLQIVQNDIPKTFCCSKCNNKERVINEIINSKIKKTFGKLFKS